MISHTVRVFKLMYIVAGILISNEEICDTVDRIQIAPRVEMKPEPEQRGGGIGGIGGVATRPERDSPKSKRRRKVSVTGLAGGMVRGVTSKVTSQVTSRMGAHCSWLYNMPLILGQWRRLALSFTVWTIPNWLLEYTSSYISRKFFINSDCDMIYK
ncbi:uncharacterized protein [Drosophila virilis]|uniref:Uncharacterized protein n=1 Tax=Drosophila virilis TaxID=7244 RepID=B4LGY6_DROVI|nr:uncharacterized protein LOC6623259 [Drosophila virilis]EDW68456.1 uncharacterized protein Dvir_GJ12725 [Drosophila virilis]